MNSVCICWGNTTLAYSFMKSIPTRLVSIRTESLFVTPELSHLIGNKRTLQKIVHVKMPDIWGQTDPREEEKLTDGVKQRRYAKAREISKAMLVCVRRRAQVLLQVRCDNTASSNSAGKTLFHENKLQPKVWTSWCGVRQTRASTSGKRLHPSQLPPVHPQLPAWSSSPKHARAETPNSLWSGSAIRDFPHRMTSRGPYCRDWPPVAHPTGEGQPALSRSHCGSSVMVAPGN